MAEINYTASTPKKQYTRRIGDNGFLGADFSTAPIFASDRRFRDLKNVWKDYKSGSGVAIETVPGFRKSTQVDILEPSYNIMDVITTSRINGIFVMPPVDGINVYGVHVGREICFLYVNENGEVSDFIGRAVGSSNDSFMQELDERYKNGQEHVYFPARAFRVVRDKPSTSIPYKNGVALFGAGAHIIREATSADLLKVFRTDMWVFGSETDDVAIGYVCKSMSEEAYVPTTYLDGVPYEQKNMLTLRSREKFTVSVTPTGDDTYEVAATIYPHEKILLGTNRHANIISVTLDGHSLAYSSDGSGTSGYQVIGTPYGSSETHVGSLYVWREFGGSDLPSDNESVTVEIEYASDATKFTSYQSVEEYKGKTTFKEGNPDYSGTAYDAIAGCTICASFDDRIFLAGNPNLPNTIFYSQRDLTGYNNPTYFGILNYNNLGTSIAPIKAMIPSATSLCVLKDDSATDPTMYFLTGVTTEHDLIPRIYTVESGLPGIGCKGAACNFLDDIVFMSRNGVIGIDKQAVNLERTLGDRSALINGKLLLEDVTQAIFAEAEGYLWCLFKNNGHVYLADSRAYTQGAGYEWYYIDSVGSWESSLANPEVDYLQYKDDIVGDEESVTIYDEDDTEHLTPYVVLPRHTDGAQALDEYGNPIESSATYTVNPDGVTHDIILVENPDPNHTGTYFQVEKTGEKVGGTFHPATCMVASNDRIFFGTDNGDLLTFNNDKRGAQAESEIAVRAEDNQIDGTDIYEKNRFPFLLRPEWYSFCGHRIESFVETSDDDGGIGNLTKDTVRRSTVVDMKAMLGSKYKITTYTDRDGWKNDNAATGSMNDASQTMLDAVNFSGDEHINVQIRERARKWVHKRYRIESNGFCSPFGLYRITYNYELNGRIK